MKMQGIFDSVIDDKTQDIMKGFLVEDLLIVHDAVPGWRAVLFAISPTSNDEIVVDILPIKKVGLFSGFSFPDKSRNKVSETLIAKYLHTIMPIIPDDYDGPLNDNISELRDIKGWNKIYPVTLTFGMLSPSDHRPDEEIIADCKSMYAKTRQRINSEMQDTQSFIGKITSALDKVDKDKLN